MSFISCFLSQFSQAHFTRFNRRYHHVLESFFCFAFAYFMPSASPLHYLIKMNFSFRKNCYEYFTVAKVNNAFVKIEVFFNSINGKML